MIRAIELRAMRSVALNKTRRIKRVRVSKLSMPSDKRALSDVWTQREAKPGPFYNRDHAKPGPVTNG